MNRLYQKCQSAGIRPQHVAEVGVYSPELSNVLPYIQAGVRTTLVEADPVLGEKIQARFANQPHVTLHRVAVSDENGTVELVQRGPSTFLSQLAVSPAIVNDGYVLSDEDRFLVKSLKFSEIDDKTIDLLSIDIEGAEWFVVKHLVSRPAVISIETHCKYYRNPYLTEIQNWMVSNNYRPWFMNDCDTVFVRADVLQPRDNDKFRLRLAYLSHHLKGWKRWFRRSS